MAARDAPAGRPFFLAQLALLLVHEMDAVREREWRMLWPFSLIRDDQVAYRLFTGAHIPLYGTILWAISSSSVRGRSRIAGSVASALSAFSIVHGLMHAAYANGWWPWSRIRDDQRGAFATSFSKTLIFAGSLFGALDLLALERR